MEEIFYRTTTALKEEESNGGKGECGIHTRNLTLIIDSTRKSENPEALWQSHSIPTEASARCVHVDSDPSTPGKVVVAIHHQMILTTPYGQFNIQGCRNLYARDFLIHRMTTVQLCLWLFRLLVPGEQCAAVCCHRHQHQARDAMLKPWAWAC